MTAIQGLGLRFAVLTVTFDSGAVDDVRVDAGTELFVAAGTGEFRKSLLVTTAAGVVSEVAGTDADTLAEAVYPAVPSGSIVLAGVEIDDTDVTGLDLSVAGNLTAVSG